MTVINVGIFSMIILIESFMDNVHTARVFSLVLNNVLNEHLPGINIKGVLHFIVESIT